MACCIFQTGVAVCVLCAVCACAVCVLSKSGIIRRCMYILASYLGAYFSMNQVTIIRLIICFIVL